METLVEIAKRLGIKPNINYTEEELHEIKRRLFKEIKKYYIGKGSLRSELSLCSMVYDTHKSVPFPENMEQTRANVDFLRTNKKEGISIASQQGAFAWHLSRDDREFVERFQVAIKMDHPDFKKLVEKLDEFIIKHHSGFKMPFVGSTDRSDSLNVYMTEKITPKIAKELHEIVAPYLDTRYTDYLDGLPVLDQGKAIPGMKMALEPRKISREEAKSIAENLISHDLPETFLDTDSFGFLGLARKGVKVFHYASVGERASRIQGLDLAYYLAGKEGKNPVSMHNYYGEEGVNYDSVDISEVQEKNIIRKGKIKMTPQEATQKLSNLEINVDGNNRITQDSKKAIQDLILQGADVNISLPNVFGAPLGCVAAGIADTELLEFLYERGCDFEKTFSFEKAGKKKTLSAMDIAENRDNKEAIQFFLKTYIGYSNYQEENMKVTERPEIKDFIKNKLRTSQQKELFTLLVEQPGADVQRIVDGFMNAVDHVRLDKRFKLQSGAKSINKLKLVETKEGRQITPEEKEMVIDAMVIQGALTGKNKNIAEQFGRIKNRFRSKEVQPESQEKTVVAKQSSKSVEEKTEESGQKVVEQPEEVNTTYTYKQIFADPDLEGVDASASPEKTIEKSQPEEVNTTYTDKQIFTDPDLEGVDASASPEENEVDEQQVETFEEALKVVKKKIENDEIKKEGFARKDFKRLDEAIDLLTTHFDLIKTLKLSKNGYVLSSPDSKQAVELAKINEQPAYEAVKLLKLIKENYADVYARATSKQQGKTSVTEDRVFGEKFVAPKSQGKGGQGKKGKKAPAPKTSENDDQGNNPVPPETDREETKPSGDKPINNRPMILGTVKYQSLEKLDAMHNASEVVNILKDIEIKRIKTEKYTETTEELAARKDLLKKVTEAYEKIAEVKAKGYDSLSPEYKAVRDQFITGKLDRLITTKALADFTQIFDGALGTMDDGIDREKTKEMLVPDPDAKLEELNIQDLTTLNDKIRNIGELIPRLEEDATAKTPQEKEVLKKVIDAYGRLRGLSWGSKEYKEAKKKYVDGLNSLIVNEELKKFTDQFDGAFGVLDDGVYRDKKIKVWVTPSKGEDGKTSTQGVSDEISNRPENSASTPVPPVEPVKQTPEEPVEQPSSTPVPPVEPMEQIPEETVEQPSSTPVPPVEPVKQTPEEPVESSAQNPEIELPPEESVQPSPRTEPSQPKRSKWGWIGAIGLLGLAGLAGLWGTKSDKQQSDKSDVDRGVSSEPKIVQPVMHEKEETTVKIRKVRVNEHEVNVWSLETPPTDNVKSVAPKATDTPSATNVSTKGSSILSTGEVAAKGTVEMFKKSGHRIIDAGKNIVEGKVNQATRNVVDAVTGVPEDAANTVLDTAKELGEAGRGLVNGTLRATLGQNANQQEDASVLSTVKTGVDKIAVRTGKDLVGGIGDVLTGNFKEGGVKLGKGIISPITGAGETLFEGGKAVGNLFNAMIDFAVGKEDKPSQNNVKVSIAQQHNRNSGR